jgi:hypothetical protein
LKLKLLLTVFLEIGPKKNNLIEGTCKPPTSPLVASPIECKAAWEDGSWDNSLLVEPGFNFRTGQHFCRLSTQSKDKTNKIVMIACLVGSSVCSDKQIITYFSPVEVNARELALKEMSGEIIVKGPRDALAKIRVS